MNLSKLMSRIKRELGLYGMALPIENIDAFIAEVIEEVTLETFSILHPRMDKMSLDLNSSENRVFKCEEYFEYRIYGKNGAPILIVDEVEPDYSLGGGWGAYGPTYRSEWRYQNILANVAMQTSGETVPALTFDWLPPNTIRIYNANYTGGVLITYGTKHDPALTSIEPTAEESFYKLAILDVKQTLYNIVKHYDDIQTVHGHISLKLDDWAEAAAKREELVNSWEDVYHLDRKQVYWA